MPGPQLTTLTAPDGTVFRDLDHDQQMAPFEDPRRTPAERADDLVGRLSLAEKVGLFFHDIIEVGPQGTPDGGRRCGGPLLHPALVLDKLINHVNVHALPSARESAQWSNALQELAATTPHSIPVTVSTDPRHSFAENTGAAFAAGAMSAWPEPLGLAALQDPERVREFADIARQEYVAVGIRSALHPQIDLGTEPRWGRQFHTFGNDSASSPRWRRPTSRASSSTPISARPRWRPWPSTSPAAARSSTARTRTSRTAASRSTPAVGSMITWCRSAGPSRSAPRR